MEDYGSFMESAYTHTHTHTPGGWLAFKPFTLALALQSVSLPASHLPLQVSECCKALASIICPSWAQTLGREGRRRGRVSRSYLGQWFVASKSQLYPANSYFLVFHFSYGN